MGILWGWFIDRLVLIKFPSNRVLKSHDSWSRARTKKLAFFIRLKHLRVKRYRSQPILRLRVSSSLLFASSTSEFNSWLPTYPWVSCFHFKHVSNFSRPCTFGDTRVVHFFVRCLIDRRLLTLIRFPKLWPARMSCFSSIYTCYPPDHVYIDIPKSWGRAYCCTLRVSWEGQRCMHVPPENPKSVYFSLQVFWAKPKQFES